jgi:P27 family predicted phage terminase small subunit
MTPTTLLPGGAMPPGGLNADAIAKWNELLPRLEHLNLLDPQHLDLFGIYCEAYGTWREALRKIQVTGYLVKAKGTIVPSPWMEIRDGASQRMMETGRVLGFDPTYAVPTRLPTFEEFSRAIGARDEMNATDLDAKSSDDYEVVGPDGEIEILSDDALLSVDDDDFELEPEVFGPGAEPITADAPPSASGDPQDLPISRQGGAQ